MPKLNDPSRAKPRIVARTLRRRIRRGELAVGAWLPSLPKLAVELGVSDWTARRGVRLLVRDGLLEPVSNRGYRVQRRQRRKVVAVLFGGAMPTSHMSPFFRIALATAQAELKRRGCQPRVYVTRSPDMVHYAGHDRLVRHLKRGLLAGVLTLAWSPRPDPRAPLSTQEGLAQLLVDSGVPYTGVSSSGHIPGAIGIDHRANVRRLVGHLLEQGARDVALMMFHGPTSGHLSTSPAIAGYREALASHGLPFEMERILQTGWPTDREGYERFVAWWRDRCQRGLNEHGAIGLAVLDNILARGAIVGALEQQVRMPEMLRLGVLSIRGESVFSPRPLVRLEIDPEAMVREVVARLLGMMHDPTEIPPAKHVTAALDTA